MKVFYARVSTQEQNEARQIEAAKAAECEKVFLDKASGKNADRKELKKMLEFVRQGDVVFVSEISRLARNTADLLNIVEALNQKGVEFVSLKEAIDTAYRNVEKIDFEKAYYRKDIGQKALAALK